MLEESTSVASIFAMVVGVGINVTPICYCGDKAVLRTTKIAKNKGKIFWGCPNFKVMLICNLCIVFV